MSKNEAAATRSDVISLADEEGVKQVLVHSILGLWDVVNNLTRLQPSRHDRYRAHPRTSSALAVSTRKRLEVKP
jgi:hypothetical protein